MEALELKNMKSILLQKRDMLVERLGKIENSKVRDEPLDADSSEQAQEIVNDEVIDALDDLEGVELSKIQKALERIENGSYGQCLECGEPISKARLKAIPFASSCIHCAEDA